jgi:hypothetical protein
MCTSTTTSSSTLKTPRRDGGSKPKSVIRIVVTNEGYPLRKAEKMVRDYHRM